MHQHANKASISSFQCMSVVLSTNQPLEAAEIRHSFPEVNATTQLMWQCIYYQSKHSLGLFPLTHVKTTMAGITYYIMFPNSAVHPDLMHRESLDCI